MSIGLVVFLLAVAGLIAYRTLGTVAIRSAGGNVASGVKQAFASFSEMGNNGVLLKKLLIVTAWIIFLWTVWYFNPTLWKEIVVGHWKAFLFCNVIASVILIFSTPKVGGTAFLIIAILLLMELGSEKSGEATRATTYPIVKTITVEPSKWEVVQVPKNHTFFVECDGPGLVKVLGNQIDPKECGPGPTEPGDWFGDDLETTGGNLYLSFTSAVDEPIEIKVKIWPNSSF